MKTIETFQLNAEKGHLTLVKQTNNRHEDDWNSFLHNNKDNHVYTEADQ